MMSVHDEILKGFDHFVEARKVFAKYEHKWFSGNDNHIGDIGEYWVMRYLINKGMKPELAPSRTSSYDIEVSNGEKYSIKTMSRWNRRGRGGVVKGISERRWDYLVAVRLDENLRLEKLYIVPYEEVKNRLSKDSPFDWGTWLDKFETEFRQ